MAVLSVGGFCAYRAGVFGQSKIDIALEQSGKLIRACQSYQKKPQANGAYPAKLMDLIEPPAGMQPVLDGGPSAIIGPWGKPYRYAIVETGAGPVPYVWTEWDYDGKLILIGAKGGPDGGTVRFNRPP
jgi:hypothetical protein